MKKPFIERAVESPALLLQKSMELLGRVGGGLSGRQSVQRVGRYWRSLGPGLTTGASDDDPSGIATYSQTGAGFGFQLLWLSVFTFPLMAVVQEMCARIGLVTGRGLAANIRSHFSKEVLYICTILLFIANALNIGADLGAMARASQLLFPHIHFSVLVVLFTVVSLGLQIFSTYEKYAKYLKYLAMILLAYVVTAFLVPHVNWAQIAQTTLHPTLVFSKDQIVLVCAILGTTISPYLFFWQTSQEVEEQILEGKTTVRERQGATADEVSRMRFDVWSGMFVSNLVMFFIIMVCAVTLHANGITAINSAADAAAALKPLGGQAAYLLFALGIIGTGMLAVPVLAGSSSYAIAESFGWKQGLYRKLQNAYAFYGVIIISMILGLAMNFIGIDPIKALIYSAVANGLVAPVVLILIVILASDHRLMGHWRNHSLSKFLGWLIIGIMIVAGIGVIISPWL